MSSKPESQYPGFCYQFDLMIDKVVIEKLPNLPKAHMEVIWLRKKQQIITKNKIDIQPNETQYYFREKLSLIATCYLNTQTKQFQRKDSSLVIILVFDGTKKKAGILHLNLSSLLNPNFHEQTSQKVIEEFMTEAKIKTKIYLKLRATYLREKPKNDQLSVGSGLSSNTANNLSNFSVSQPKQRFTDKKYDIPSKDTYSVLSYGGGIRYSHKKEDTSSVRRDDSGKKEQYSKDYGTTYGGYYNRDNPFNRTANQYNLNNRVSSSNLGSKTKNTDSEHNKSNILGEQNSKLLAEEQKTRSKLEAQLTRNKVQIQELKSKLSEYLHENMKVKEELQGKGKMNAYEYNELVRQKQELKNKNYILNSEVSELKQCFSKSHELQKENAMMKNEKQNVCRQMYQQKDEILEHKRENETIKAQIHVLQSSEQKLMKQLQQMQYFSQNNEEIIKTKYQQQITELSKEIESKKNKEHNVYMNVHELQRKVQQYEQELINKNNSIYSIQSEYKYKLQGKQQQQYKYKQQLNNKIMQCEAYKNDLEKVKSDVNRIKDEKTAEYQQRVNILSTQNSRIKNSLKSYDEKISQLTRDKYELGNRHKQEIDQINREVDKYRMFQNKYNEQIIINNNNQAKLQQLTEMNHSINRQLQAKKAQITTAMCSNEENENLLKQNLQLQLQLKYKNEELERLKKMEEEYHEIKYNYDLKAGNNRELQEQSQRIQKQLKEKNRAYIVQNQRVKMLTDQKNNMNAAYNKIKKDLQNAENIIHNGNIQVRQMDNIIYDLDMHNKKLITDNEQLARQNTELKQSNSKVTVEKYEAQIMAFQRRVKELQRRQSQKIKSISDLNKNLANSYKEIKQLQQNIQLKQKDLQNKDNIIDQLNHNFLNAEEQKNKNEQQLNNRTKDYNQMKKRSQMVKDELYVYKKKFQEQKGRSTSTMHIRSSEDFMKMKNMENQLQKKDERIRKLQKQLMNLEDQNVKQSIEFMKRFQDLKGKFDTE